MNWRNTSLLAAALWLAAAQGAPVGPDEARRAVENWLAQGDTLGCAMGATVRDAVEYSGEGGAGAFYVVPLADSGGDAAGYVVVSADTRITPVMAFSGDGEFTADSANPLLAIVASDAARATEALAGSETSKIKLLSKTASDAQSENEAKWSALLAERPLAKTKNLLTAASIADVRVDTLIATRWNQNKSKYGDDCYDYYTPNHYPCGCVATAFAQLLYYHRAPSGAVQTRWDCSGDNGSGGKWSMAAGTTLGPWEWSSMAASPSSAAERQAVGRLTWDLGRLCNMNYGKSGSGAEMLTIRRRLQEELACASSQAYFCESGIDTATLKKAAIPSLDAKLPVLLAIFNSSGAHAVMGDGYGYSGGDFYLHINMGWGGSSDAWYQPPNIHNYTAISEIIYNVYPAHAIGYATIASGRVFNASGAAVAGQSVTAVKASDGTTYTATTDSKGIYALLLPPDAEYKISAESDGLRGMRTIQAGHCVSPYITSNGAFSNADGYGWSDWQAGQGERNSVGNVYDVDLTMNALFTPVFSPASGTVFETGDAAVALACASAGATIRYTLDGSDPTESSAAYSGPIRLGTGTTTVKARAFRDGCEPSEIATAVFTNPPQAAAPALTPLSALVEGTNVFLSRRFTFTLASATEGAAIRYTLDGSDPTEASALYTGEIELEAAVGETRTVKIRAFADDCRPSETVTLTFKREEPESWIDERPATHEGTGWWWPERTDFASDGRLHLQGDYYYHPNKPSAERCAIIDSTMSFDVADESDALRPDDDAKAAVRIGPAGGFQLYTRFADGSRGWIDVAAEGVSAAAGCEYTFRFRLDCTNRVYTAAIVAPSGEIPLKARSRSRFRFANGERSAVREISYSGSGALSAIIGTTANRAINPVDGTTVFLK